MVEYNNVNIKFSGSQINNFRSAAKNQTGLSLRTNSKMFNGNNLSHKVLLTAEQASKLGNVIKSNISSDKSCVEFKFLKQFCLENFQGHY